MRSATGGGTEERLRHRNRRHCRATGRQAEADGQWGVVVPTVPPPSTQGRRRYGVGGCPQGALGVEWGHGEGPT